MSHGWAAFGRPETWTFLGGGLLITLRIAFVTVLLSLGFGTLLAFASMSRFGLLSGPANAYVLAIRGVPVFLIILMTYFGLGRLQIHVSIASAVTIALVGYTTAYISEIVRSGILSIVREQMEAARALALSRVQALRYIVLPQAFRIMVPPLINQYIIATTGTSIGAVVGLDELLRRSIILYNANQNPLQTLTVTGSIYFLVLSSLSIAGKHFEAGAGGATRRPPTAPQ